MSTLDTKPRSIFIDSASGARTSRVPTWLMRQASRYLPEYKDLRQRYSYRDICTTPDLAVEATRQPVVRFGLDAGVTFTDPLLFLEPLGVDVAFTDSGPVIQNPVQSRGEINQLAFRSGISAGFGYLADATRDAADALGEVPLVAVCGGPFTLAGYLLEGRTSRSVRHLKALLLNDPAAARSLFEGLSDLVSEAVAMQLENGAQAFMILESWAGQLTARDFRQQALPYLTDIFTRLRGYHRPGIIYVNGCQHLIDLLVRTGAEVIGLDWRVELERVRTRLPENVSIQGNLDPSVLLGSPDHIRDRAVEILIQGTLYRGHVFNLGAGILPDTPTENVQTLVDVVRDFDSSLEGWRSVRP